MSLGCGRESWIWATLVVSVEIFEDCPLVRALGAWGQLDQLPSREGQQRDYFSLKLTQRALSILRAGKIEIFLRIKRLSFLGGFEGWICLVLVALFISKMYNSFLAYICHLLILVIFDYFSNYLVLYRTIGKARFRMLSKWTFAFRWGWGNWFGCGKCME